MILPYVFAGAVAVFLGIAGGLLTTIGPWYRNLRKPRLQPPDWLFGPAWTIILALAAYSAGLAWNAAADPAARARVVILFGLNALFHLLWSPLFFKFRRPDLALIEVVFLWASLVALVIGLAPISTAASLLILPYLAWVSFATWLNWTIVRLNGPFKVAGRDFWRSAREGVQSTQRQGCRDADERSPIAGRDVDGERSMIATPQGTAAPPAAAADPEVRQISESDLSWALAEGWKDFNEKRGDLIFAGLLYPVIGLITAALATNDRLLPLFFPLVAGLSILGPAVASGFYELARRREEGSDASWWHFVDPLRGRSRDGLLVLTGGLAGLFLAWLLAAWLIYGATIGRTEPAGAADFFARLFQTPQGWTMILVGNLVGLVLAIAALAFSVVSFPMVVDKSYDPATAVRTSLRAVARNPRVMASWGLRVAGLLALGCLPAFVGLAVVLPVLGYATWHLYTRLVAR